MPDWIPIIANPAAGQKGALLAEINQVFRPAGVRWSVKVTHESGDAKQLAAMYAAEGAELVAVYGGDGTIAEAAAGLAGSETALGLLPGGTGNVVAHEFGIPRNLTAAAEILISSRRTRSVDLGRIADDVFLIRAGVGLEPAVVERTPRTLKDRFGLLAYGIGGLQALAGMHIQTYQLVLDGETLECSGVACTVANASHLGLPGLSLSPLISMEDGLLDVIVLRPSDLTNLITLISEALGETRSLGRLQHWKVREARIEVDPPQSVQADGDSLGMTPVEITVMPNSLRVVVPE